MIQYILLTLLAVAHCAPEASCPECYLTTPMLCKYNGYKSETFHVNTQDGYVLAVHRIPPTKKHVSGGNPVIFLQHGLLDSSSTWVVNGNKSLGFMLADAGYDVFMGNVRGNKYSRWHIHLTNNDPKFWDFSFDQMAEHDLPTMINLALRKTNQTDLFYLGHSQGSEIGFIKLSTDKELAAKVKMFIVFAPVARMTHAQGLIAYLAKAQWGLKKFFSWFGVNEFLPNSTMMQLFAYYVCPAWNAMCSNIIFMMSGPSDNLDMSRLAIYEAHTPAGTSTKNIRHWLQLVTAGKQQMFDFESSSENFAHYNQSTVPEYDISGLSVPTVLVQGGKDWLGEPRDEMWLMSKIHKAIHDIIYIENFNHLDALWGMEASNLVYKPIMAMMDKMLQDQSQNATDAPGCGSC